VDRATVARHLAANAATNPGAGSADSANAVSSLALGSRPGPPSRCAPYETQIITAVEADLTDKRIHQGLRYRGFGGGYSSVKLFVSRLRLTVELPHRRMECKPGAEMQFDFGQGAWVRGEARRRRPNLFRAVLSHSRKGYSEVVWRQDTESVIRCIENAFRAFGGVTATIVPDNLKAAVIQLDRFDPEINPKLRAFCARHGTATLPTKPGISCRRGQGRGRREVCPKQRAAWSSLRESRRVKLLLAGVGAQRRRPTHPRHHPPASRCVLRAGGAAAPAAIAGVALSEL
jgi:hypothetical protein